VFHLAAIEALEERHLLEKNDNLFHVRHRFLPPHGFTGGKARDLREN
jgi:hypothetical protein